MRYSRIQPGPRYISSTAVVVSEVLKCTICFAVHLYQQRNKHPSIAIGHLSDEESSSPYSIRQLRSDIFSVKSGFLKVLVPAVLYTLQNNLQFVAASNLDAATFQVTYQCKILTTALFAVILLEQSLSWVKWFSLLILTMGVGCVQIPSSAANMPRIEGNYFIGIFAVAIACLCSGLAGVYFERVLKTGSTTSIWVRNIQLSVGCLAIAVVSTLILDGPAIVQKGFFHGYSTITVFTIFMQAAGGLIVAMVIKYTDNILKGFATSLSIILSTVASVFIFNFVITIYFLIGSALVFFSTYLYSKPDTSKTTVQTVEQNPLLNLEDHDEKLQWQGARFRDNSNIEPIDERNREPSRTRIGDEERKIYKALGYAS
ncbi:hypothetical protein DV736_g3836, partial [Chaetothyriales sp. CBS 134916]